MEAEILIKEWLEQMLDEAAEDAEESAANSDPCFLQALWGDGPIADTQRAYAKLLTKLKGKVDEIYKLATED